MEPSREESVLLPHGGYRNLRSYKVAEAVYDATVVFCRRFLPEDRRQTDQMIQAARSGVRNISEGSGAAATSRKSEMKLTNVARASLSDELLWDYEGILRNNGLRIWPKDSREARAMRSRLAQDQVPNLPPARPGTVRLTGLFGLAEFVAQASLELAANAMLCAVNQAAYLLKRQLERQSRDFIEQGGFTENLYRARNQRTPGARPTRTPTPSSPPCPSCGQPMRRRTARHGAHAGQPFWGCSTYPACRGTRPFRELDPSARSDQSDRSDQAPPPP